jgi:hypothetical protein
VNKQDVYSSRLWPNPTTMPPTCTSSDELALSAKDLITRRISSARLGAPRGTIDVRLEIRRGRDSSELIHPVHTPDAVIPTR